MIAKIIKTSLNQRLLVVAIAVLTLLFGVSQLEDMPVDVLPEFSRPYVEIQTEALGLSAAEVESLITVPLEADMLNGVAWVDEIRSESIPGLSSIVLLFEPGTDIMAGRQMVQERLIAVHALPNVSKPPVMLQPLSSTSRILTVGLSSKEMSLIDMSVLARWTIKPRLMGVKGVANVSVWGQRERQLQVRVDPQHLQAQGVTLNQVINTTGNALWVSPLSYLNASTPGTGGWIDTPNQRLGIQHVSPITTPEDLARVTVEHTQAQLRLGDVADVVEDHQPLIGDAVVNDTHNLILVIEKFPWANTWEVTDDVEDTLEALQAGLTGLEMDTNLFRPATFIEKAIGNLSTAMIFGGVLVIILLFTFLFEWRTVLISSVAIPLSLVTAGLMLSLYGTSFNMMILAGLVMALCVVIDDAVIDAENIVRRLRQYRHAGSDKSTVRIILEAAFEIRSPVIYATVILLLVMAPLFFMESLTGAFFKPITVAYALAVLASMLVALTVTPALSLLVFGDAVLNERRESPLVRLLRRTYETILPRIARAPRVVLTTVCLVLLAGLAMVPMLRQESLLPEFKETDLLIRWESPPGTSLQAMNRITSQATRELRSVPGIRNVSAQIGRAVTSDSVVDINAGEIWVNIDTEADYDETKAAIEQVVDGYPGLSHDVMTYLQKRVREELAGTGDAIVLRVYGENLQVLRSKAEEIKLLLAKIDGLVDLQVEGHSLKPNVEIEVNLANAQPYGLKPGDVRRAAATLLAGIQVGSLFEKQKVFDVVVWGRPENHRSLTDVRELLIDTPSGGQVRLADVADVRVVPTPHAINREAVSRRIDVSANVHGRDLASIGREIKKRLQEIEFPLEYRAELRGESAEQWAAQKRGLSIAFAAAVVIFLLLQRAFGSWRLAAVIFLTLPVALVGGVLAVIASGSILSLGSFFGFVTVLGVAARNGITLIKHYHYLEQHEDATVPIDLVLRGTRERFAPIVTTAATTALAVLPFALLGEIAGLEVIQPMAIVFIGGLITSTLLTLLGVPALYLLFGTTHEPDLDLFTVEAGAEKEVHDAF